MYETREKKTSPVRLSGKIKWRGSLGNDEADEELKREVESSGHFLVE